MNRGVYMGMSMSMFTITSKSTEYLVKLQLSGFIIIIFL